MTDNNKLTKIRHSLAHVIAAAVKEIYPDVKFGIGPVIDNGFYYDFDFSLSGESVQITPSMLAEIEKKMRFLIDKKMPFEQKFVPIATAIKNAKTQGEVYKLELLEEIKAGKRPFAEADLDKTQDNRVSFYKVGKFIDLCRGPHVKNTKELPTDGFKLTRVAGAYWHGDEKNKMLTRIYGAAFETKKHLDEYLWAIEEAEKRDHRRLGKQLDLFTFSELVGSGLPLYTPKGALIRRLLNDYVEELQSEAGYTQVWTPQIAKAELFKISGHYDKYKDSMFRVVSNYSEEEFFLKPMNCPQHTQIYASRMRSYRDLPLRYSDFAMLYRDEKPGELNGLARVRSFSQDDCHVYCREDQVDKEIDTMLDMTKKIMKTFGFKYRYRLSTHDPKHPEKYIGDPKTWDRVEKWAEKIIKRNKIEYFDGPGEAAFYAPKMDLMATDALGREWQLSTIQIDFFMPERFDLAYIDERGQKKRPVMIHRAIIGSPERFIMVLLEHFAGAFPLWLAPVQAAVIPISDKSSDYAKTVAANLRQENLRVEFDERTESVGKKIREAELQKIPCILVVGEKEQKSNTVAVRRRGQGDLGPMKLEKFVKDTKEEIVEKRV